MSTKTRPYRVGQSIRSKLHQHTSGRREPMSRGTHRPKDHERAEFKLESVTMARLAALGI